MDYNPFLTDYYATYNEDGRLTSRHGFVEYHTTMRYIKKYLKDGDRVLEIGAGTGRYSHALAQRGYAVDAVELVQHNINVFRKNTQPGENIRIFQGNALDLTFLPDNAYEITLLLGPLYHLYTYEDQRQAIREAIRVTAPGGVIYAAYCGNDATIVQFCFQRGMLKEERYQAQIDPVTFKASSTPEEIFNLFRKEDIDALLEGLPVKRLHFVGTDMASLYIRDTVDAMDDQMYEQFLKYHDFIYERPDMVGVSHHFLDVFQKL